MKIGNLEIKKMTGYSLVDISKRTEILNKKTGKMETKDSVIASNSYLTWTLKSLIREGNKIEQVDAEVVLNALDNELKKNNIVNNCDHMVELRKIEGKFFDAYGERFEVVNGEMQIKLF